MLFYQLYIMLFGPIIYYVVLGQLYIMLFWTNCILCCFGPTVYYVVFNQLYIMLMSTNCILCCFQAAYNVKCMMLLVSLSFCHTNVEPVCLWCWYVYCNIV